MRKYKIYTSNNINKQINTKNEQLYKKVKNLKIQKNFLLFLLCLKNVDKYSV